MKKLPPPSEHARVPGPPPAAYAGFWRRAGASLLDGSAVQLALLAIRAGLVAVFAVRLDVVAKMEAFAVAPHDAPLEELTPLLMASLAALALWFAIGAAVHVTYFALQEGSSRSATVGKRAVALQVVDATTLAPISRRRAAVRTLAKVVSLVPFGLGYLAMLWHPQRRCWHDRLSGTAVIVAAPPSDAVAREQAEAPAAEAPGRPAGGRTEKSAAGREGGGGRSGGRAGSARRRARRR